MAITNTQSGTNVHEIAVLVDAPRSLARHRHNFVGL